MSRKSLIILSSLVGLMLVFGLAYSRWNHMDPERSCGSCHEIVPAMEIWQNSAHRNITCTACHGTAMGSLHSLQEKTRMLFTHYSRDDQRRKPGLDEAGVMDVMEACISCHQDEYRAWSASGHSATYAHIFLNEKHNGMERPYPACFRCHGMYYDKGIDDLVAPISTEGPWELLEEKHTDPVIPCLACHPIHHRNTPMRHPGTMDDPGATFYARDDRQQMAGLYLRSERSHLLVDQLPKARIFQDGREVLVSDDPVQALCAQCHAPNWAHEAGSEDDKTPTGVHEGISCRACHRDHSNNPKDACKTCHPAVTSCNEDVMAMNTTYLRRDSPNDIHSMKCTDCHDPIPVMP